MPDFNPYDLADDETNPYAPPKASLEGAARAATPDLERAESMRRYYLNHEASVRSVGALYLFGAFFGAIVTAFAVYFAVAGFPAQQAGQAEWTGVVVFVAVLYGGLTVLSAALGIGLRRLKTWARWVTVVLTGLNVAASLLYCAVLLLARPEPIVLVATGIGLMIPVYILYLLVSPKGTVVFSSEYRHVIEQTPHIKYKMSCLVKGLVYGFVALIVSSIVIAILGALFGNK